MKNYYGMCALVFAAGTIYLAAIGSPAGIGTGALFCFTIFAGALND